MKRKFQQHFYVGEIIQDTDKQKWEVMSAKFVRFYDKNYPNWDKWEYTLQLVGSKHQEDIELSRTNWIPYTIITTSLERLFK